MFKIKNQKKKINQCYKQLKHAELGPHPCLQKLLINQPICCCHCELEKFRPH